MGFCCQSKQVWAHCVGFPCKMEWPPTLYEWSCMVKGEGYYLCVRIDCFLSVEFVRKNSMTEGSFQCYIHIGMHSLHALPTVCHEYSQMLTLRWLEKDMLPLPWVLLICSPSGVCKCYASNLYKASGLLLLFFDALPAGYLNTSGVIPIRSTLSLGPMINPT